jgi:hypothetical protein
VEKVNILPVKVDHEVNTPEDCKDVNGGIMFATTSFEGEFLCQICTTKADFPVVMKCVMSIHPDACPKQNVAEVFKSTEYYLQSS